MPPSPDSAGLWVLKGKSGPEPAGQVGDCENLTNREIKRGVQSPDPLMEETTSMIGLVLVTHGRLAKEFVAATEHVVGAQEDMRAICIGPDDDMEQRRNDILEAVNQVNSGNGVIVLTDMFGGTPSNLSISIMDKEKVEVIAGINLPMLIRLAGFRTDGTLEEAVDQAQEAGRKYISIASKILSGEGK